MYTSYVWARKWEKKLEGYIVSALQNNYSNILLKGLPFVYEKVRISRSNVCDKFLQIFELEKCNISLLIINHFILLICFKRPDGRNDL